MVTPGGGMVMPPVQVTSVSSGGTSAVPSSGSGSSGMSGSPEHGLHVAAADAHVFADHRGEHLLELAAAAVHLEDDPLLPAAAAASDDLLSRAHVHDLAAGAVPDADDRRSREDAALQAAA